MNDKFQSSDVNRIEIYGESPGDLTDFSQTAMLEYLQIGPGVFDGKLAHINGRRIRLTWGRYNLPVVGNGKMASGYALVGFGLNSGGSRVNAQSVLPDSLLIFGEDLEFTTVLPANCNWVTIQVRHETLDDLGLNCKPNSFRHIELTADSADIVRRCLMPVVRDLSHKHPGVGEAKHLSSTLAQAENFALDTLIHAPGLKSEFRRPLRTDLGNARAYKLARLATDLMRANYSEPLSIAYLCETLGCNYRALDRAFSRAFEVSPSRYLRMLRLANLRDNLLHGQQNTRLSDVYLRCGLTHFGRAAADYVNVYGESPSTTLASRRR